MDEKETMERGAGLGLYQARGGGSSPCWRRSRIAESVGTKQGQCNQLAGKTD